MSGFQIAEVRPGSDGFARFLALPGRVYADGHRWVPQPEAATAAELTEGNLFFRHGEAQAFVCLDGEDVVGRIVASVDHALAEPDVGHFGFFEAIENPEVAAALIGAAECWLAARGRTRVHGPVDLSIFHRYRLQTHGFDTIPFLGEPRSPRYYAALIEGAGYAPVMRWHSWDLPASALGLFLDAMAPRAAAAAEAFRVEPFDMDRFDAEMATIHPLVVDTFRDNYGFTAIDLEEFQQRFGDARHVMSPEASSKIFDREGRLVAYSYAYPDPGPDRLFVAHTFGIARDCRQGGIAELLFKVGLEAVIGRHDQAVGALAKEGPAAYARFGAPTRSYAVYGRRLA